MRAGRTRALLAGVLLLLWLALPSAAGAHAILLRSDPADPCSELTAPRPPSADPRCTNGLILPIAPAAVHLWFSEPVEPFAGGIVVLGPAGHRVNRGPVRSDHAEMSVEVDASEEGTYLVEWRVVSSDTHPTRGSFAFSVGRAGSAPASVGGRELGAVPPLGLALQALARWLHYAGYALGFGPLVFLVLVLWPLGLERGEAERRLLSLVGIGIAALLVAELLALLAESASLAPGQGLSLDVVGDVLGSSFGRVFAQRLAAALLLWTLLGATHPRPGPLPPEAAPSGPTPGEGEPPPERGSRGVILACLAVGLALAFADGEASHAGSRAPLWIGFGLNALHIGAMGIWFGGLLSLLAVWNLPDLKTHSRELLRRFAVLAGGSLLVLAASGALMARQHLAQPLDLQDTPYGQVLVIKIGLVFGAAELALIATRIAGTARGRLWQLEAAALAGVLGLAGLLVSLPPPQ